MLVIVRLLLQDMEVQAIKWSMNFLGVPDTRISFHWLLYMVTIRRPNAKLRQGRPNAELR